ncbi:MAG: T9SS type A sorting domain-containing protein, partial [Ignavibacteriaceae bacterium]|nr:T9SS type A sorting domain-containing protein [Ignavibacteriaceae bacterium]
YSQVSDVEISTPKDFELSQNYPNPFNPSTKISYTLPFDSKVTLEVFSITGSLIGQLVNNEQPAGYYSVDFNSSSKNLSSGIYFYRISAVDNTTGKEFSSIKKMLLLK